MTISRPTLSLWYLIILTILFIFSCTPQCPTGHIVQWCPDPDEPEGVRPICCPDMTICNCMDEPTIPGWGMSKQSLSEIPEPDLSDTTLDGVVDFGISTLIVEIPGEGDKIEIPVKGRLAMNGGICAQQNCPLEIILLELLPLKYKNKSTNDREVKGLSARNANLWKGHRSSLGNIEMEPTNKLAIEATIDGKKFGRILNPNANFNGRLLVNNLRDKGGAQGKVNNNRLWIQGQFSDDNTNANFEISIWLTDCRPTINLQAVCFPNIESGLPGKLHLKSDVKHQGNFKASYDLCSAMYTDSYENICTAKKTGDDVFSSTFNCSPDSEIDPLDPAELSKLLKYQWKDAKQKIIGTKKELVLDYVPVFPVRLTIENKWGKTESETIRTLECLKELPLSPGGCAWYPVDNSHSAYGSWCPEGSFITQYDLDSDAGLSKHDSPIIRKVRCCAPQGLPFPLKWESCSWVKVGAQESHNKINTWCPKGTFLTQLDLDGDRNLSGSDAPIIGQAKCCEPESSTNSKWGECHWFGVGPERSHSEFSNWCPQDYFLIQVDLDGGINGKDFPIVKDARCCTLE